jgi:hypothetical protein
VFSFFDFAAGNILLFFCDFKEKFLFSKEKHYKKRIMLPESACIMRFIHFLFLFIVQFFQLFHPLPEVDVTVFADVIDFDGFWGSYAVAGGKSSVGGCR